jgi:hypothetical protein
MIPKRQEKLAMLPEVRRTIKLNTCSKPRLLATAIAAALMLSTAGLTAQDTTTLLVLRPVPKTKKADPSTPIAPLLQSDIAEIKIGGKPATITAWTPLLKGPTTLQLVVLFDSAQQNAINSQIDDIRKLFASLPSNVEIAVGTLLQGKAKIIQPFTADHALAGAALHPPSKEEATGPKADNGDPYYCLQDLATHWPDPDPAKVRAVLVFTDGIVRYNNSGYASQANPTVDIAAQSLLRAGIAPFAIYSSERSGAALPGQIQRKGCTDCLDQLAATTNGQALYYAEVNSQTPNTSFSPLLYRFYAILHTEAVVTVTAKGSGAKTLDLKSSRDDIKVEGPESVMLGNLLPKK